MSRAGGRTAEIIQDIKTSGLGVSPEPAPELPATDGINVRLTEP